MAVIGACAAPAKTATMPTSAKTPPDPPEPSVSDVATSLPRTCDKIAHVNSASVRS